MGSEALERVEACALDGYQPSLDALVAEACRRDFSRFVREGWQAVEPDAALLWEMPHQVVAEHVQELLLGWVRQRLWQYVQPLGGRLPAVPTTRLPRVRREREREVARRADLREKWALGNRLRLVLRDGRVQRPGPQRFRALLVNIGTGYGKSNLCHVFAPAWLWLQWPSAWVLGLSINVNAVVRDAGKHKALIQHPWYRGLFSPWWGLDRKKDGEPHFRNTARGERIARGWWAQIQGERGHLQLVDDPEDPDDVYSDAERSKGHRRWDTTLERRVHAGGTSIRLATQQRLHAEDWSAHVLHSGGWEHLELPTLAESTPSPCTCPTHKRGTTALGWRDTRAPGEPLAPRLVPEADIAERQRKGVIFRAQDQQRPEKLQGNIFRADAWRFWRFADEDSVAELADRTIILPPREVWEEHFEELLLSGDLSFGGAGSSQDALGVWGRRGERRVLLECTLEGLSATRARVEVRRLLEKVPGVGPKLLERAANGGAVVDALVEGAEEMGQQPVEGVIPVPATVNKVLRGISIQHLQEAGNIYLPLHHPKREEMVAQASAFPRNGVRNDFVDMMSQALRYWATRGAFVFE